MHNESMKSEELCVVVIFLDRKRIAAFDRTEEKRGRKQKRKRERGWKKYLQERDAIATNAHAEYNFVVL